MLQVNKIQIKGEKIHLEYSKRIPKGNGEELVDDYTMTCSEAPLPDFHRVLQSLKEYVVEICELPDNYADGIKVTGVSFTHDDESWGAVMSAVKTLKSSNTPFNIHTPWKEASHEFQAPTKSAGENKILLSKNCTKSLELLREHCFRYIDGERAQVTLPFETKGKRTKAEA